MWPASSVTLSEHGPRSTLRSTQAEIHVMSKRLILTLAMSLLFVSLGISEIFDEKGELLSKAAREARAERTAKLNIRGSSGDMIGA